MFSTIFPIVALAVSMLLAMYAAERFVAFTQQRRFTLRGLLFLMFLVSVGLSIVSFVVRK